jgi:hypothetical protein
VIYENLRRLIAIRGKVAMGADYAGTQHSYYRLPDRAELASLDVQVVENSTHLERIRIRARAGAWPRRDISRGHHAQRERLIRPETGERRRKWSPSAPASIDHGADISRKGAYRLIEGLAPGMASLQPRTTDLITASSSR